MASKVISTRSSRILLVLVASQFLSAPVRAEDGVLLIPRGPDDVSSRVEEMGRPKEPTFDFAGIDRSLEPLMNWKSGLVENGFRLGFDYNFLGQSANNTVGADSAVGGIFRGYFSWDLWNRANPSRTGTLDVRVENRHAIGGGLPPENLAFNFGWAGTTGPDWTDQGWGLPVFMLRQRLDFGQTPVELRIGRMSAFSQFDITPFSDNLTAFTNNSIILNPTIAYPSAGSFGIAGYAGFPRSNLYVLGMIMDANGSYSELGFDSLSKWRVWCKL